MQTTHKYVSIISRKNELPLYQPELLSDIFKSNGCYGTVFTYPAVKYKFLSCDSATRSRLFVVDTPMEAYYNLLILVGFKGNTLLAFIITLCKWLTIYYNAGSTVLHINCKTGASAAACVLGSMYWEGIEENQVYRTMAPLHIAILVQEHVLSKNYFEEWIGSKYCCWLCVLFVLPAC